MKNKKGFTLVELLAVIALLGVLVLIVTPKVIDNYNKSKKMILIDEAKSFYNDVTNKYLEERMSGNKISEISNDNGKNINTIAMEGEEVYYTVHLDSDGSVTAFKFRNNKYCISGVGNFLDTYNVEEVKDLDGTTDCEVDSLMNGELVRVDLLIKTKDKPVDTNHSPKTIFLKVGTGWLDSDLSTAKSINSLETIPSKKNYYYDGFYFTNNSENEIKVVDCKGSIVASEKDFNSSLLNSKAYANFIKKSYTISYNGNGSTSGSMDDKKIEYGSNENYKIEDNAFVRTGYRFIGWNDSQDGKGKTFNVGDNTPNITEDNENDNSYYKFDSSVVCASNKTSKIITLYAQWEGAKYIVKFNSNGGTGEMDALSIEFGKEVSLTKNSFKKVGYSFSKWKDNENNKEYNDSQTVKNLTDVQDKVINLNAVWTPIKYNITYDYDGGVKGKNSPTSASYDEEITISNPTKEGLAFAGWKIEKMDDTTHYFGSKTSNDRFVTNISETKFKNLRSTSGEVKFTATWKSNFDLAYMYVDNNGNSTLYQMTLKDSFSNDATEWKVDENGNWNITLKKVGSYDFHFENDYASSFDAFIIGAGGGGGGSYHSFWCSEYCYATGGAGTGGNGGNINYVKNLLVSNYNSSNSINVIVGKGGSGGPGNSKDFGESGGKSQFGKYIARGGNGGSPKGEIATSNGGSGNISGKLGGRGAYYTNSTDGYSKKWNALKGLDGYYAFNNSSFNGIKYSSSGGGGASSYTSAAYGGSGAGSGVGITDGNKNATTYGSGGGGGQYIGGEYSFNTSDGGNGYQGVIFLSGKYLADDYIPEEEYIADEYNIEYDYAGGIAGEKAPTSAKFDEDFIVSEPTREGYTFTGWKITGMDSGTTHYYGESTTTATTIEETKVTSFRNLNNIKNKTVYFTALWTEVIYTLEYDYDNGKVSSKNVTSAKYTKSFSVNTPTKSDLTFIGWNITNMDDVIHTLGKNTTSSENISITRETSFKNLRGHEGTVKFKAIWDTYAISYKLNNGILANDTPLSGTLDKEITINNPTREGYTFTGWNITNMENITHTIDGVEVKGTTVNKTIATKYKNLRKTKGAVTFTATWKENGYEIAYELNGGVNNSKNPSKGVFDTTLTIKNPTKEGYTFTGWTITGLDNTMHTYGKQTTIENIIESTKETTYKNLRSTSGTVKFTANWDSYSITYKLNDGSLGSEAPVSGTLNKEITISNPTKEGYTFTGWKITGMDSGSIHYYGNETTKKDSISLTKETTYKNLNNKNGTVTFSANWVVNTYTITYDYDGGKKGDASPTTAKYNSTISISNPTKTGYTFVGWKITGLDKTIHTYGEYTTNETSIELTKEKNYKNLRSTSGEVKFTATWKPIYYSISYALDDGYFDVDYPNVAIYDSEVIIYYPIREGYTFTGWKITNMDGVTHYYGNDTTTSNTISLTTSTTYKNLRSTSGTVKFTAKWDANKYTLEYDYDGGKKGTYAPNTGTFDSIVTISNPTKTGYTFSGWTITGLDNTTHTYGKQTNTENTIFSTKETTYKNLRSTSGTVKFKANWIANTYNISFDLKSGVLDDDLQTTYKYDEEITIKNPTREGYTFAGWKITNMDGVTHYYGNDTTTSNTISLTTSTTYKNLRSTSGTVKFTAKWNANKYTLEYDYDGGKKGTYAPNTGTFDSKTTITNPTRKGYTFTGWTITGMDNTTHTYGNQTTTDASIELTTSTTYKNLRSTSGIVKFTANWKEN